MDTKVTRKATSPIRVWVTPAEKEEITRLAEVCGMSVSAYARNVCLGAVPRSRLDNIKIDNLMKVNGDQGRIGGELKWLLTKMDETDKAVFRRRIDEILTAIYGCQNLIRNYVESFLNGTRDKKGGI